MKETVANSTGQERQRTNEDVQLHRLLQSWQALEPSEQFAAGVWRRIHRGRFAADSQPARPVLIVRPVQAVAAAIIVGILLGFWAAWLSLAAEPVTGIRGASIPVRTLTGTYTSIAVGDGR